MKHFILIFALSFLFACSTDTKNSPTEEQKTKPVSVNSDPKFDVIMDSVSTSWERLVSDEEQRLEDIQRLVQEVSYLSKRDNSQLKIALELITELEKYNYDQNNIPSFDVVSKNDDRIDEIINVIFTFTDESLDTTKSYPLITELKVDIQKSLLETSLELSSTYSQFVFERNSYIEMNKSKLEEMGYKDLEQLNSFFDTTNI